LWLKFYSGTAWELTKTQIFPNSFYILVNLFEPDFL
jgi:hypothetical protein